MSAQNDPPLTRREARRRQQLANEAAPAGEAPNDHAATPDTADATPDLVPASVGSVAGSAASVSSAPVAPSAPAAPWAATPGSYRRRDFAPSTPAAPSAPYAGRQTFAPAGQGEPQDEPLGYRTQGREIPASAPHSASTHTASSAPDEPSVPSSDEHDTRDGDRPLSRRELRERRRAHEPEQSADLPEPLPADGLDIVDPVSAASVPTPAPASFLPAGPAPLADDARPSVPDVLPGTAASPHAPSVGSHWSVGVHDDDDPFTNTFSRQVGSATTSTNALVLPEMPRGDLAGPVPGTGEIIITGMIDVPSSVASTGAVPSIHDSPDLDDLFDVDTEYASTDSAPVSAISAVSSHTATRDVMGGKKARRSGVLTTVLVSSTVVLAVVAVGLFIVAAVNGLF
ncbi:MAG TPA: hypothetical protein VFM95_05315 [Microcella sp.]|nr:hypothetical protein [Microcella sp.]